MARLKVMTVVGTRPEIIRLSRVMAALDRHTDHVLVHTGQNYDYELNQVFFDDLELRPPDHYLDAAGQTAAETIGQVIIAVDRVLGEVSPDAVLILGDTNSCLAAIPAKRRKIPVFHMEAGNRCFDQRVPEEINRRIVDHVADINLPVQRHLAGVPAARGPAAGPGDQDRQPDVRGAPPLHAEDRAVGRFSPRLGLEPRRLLRRQLPPRGERRLRAELRRARRDPEQPGADHGKPRDRDDAPADPTSGSRPRAWCSIRSSSCTSRSASPTT